MTLFATTLATVPKPTDIPVVSQVPVVNTLLEDTPAAAHDPEDCEALTVHSWIEPEWIRQRRWITTREWVTTRTWITTREWVTTRTWVTTRVWVSRITPFGDRGYWRYSGYWRYGGYWRTGGYWRYGGHWEYGGYWEDGGYWQPGYWKPRMIQHCVPVEHRHLLERIAMTVGQAAVCSLPVIPGVLAAPVSGGTSIAVGLVATASCTAGLSALDGPPGPGGSTSFVEALVCGIPVTVGLVASGVSGGTSQVAGLAAQTACAAGLAALDDGQ